MSDKPCVVLMGMTETYFSQTILDVQKLLEDQGVAVLLVDVGSRSVKDMIVDISSSEVRFQHFKFKENMTALRREAFDGSMAECCASLLRGLQASKRIHAVLSIGRRANVFLVDAVLHHRALPIGFPKFVVDDDSSNSLSLTKTDIFSVRSLANMHTSNFVLSKAMENVAASVAGMSKLHFNQDKHVETTAQLVKSNKRNHDGNMSCSLEASHRTKKRIAITVCISITLATISARNYLEILGFEVLQFRADGSGGIAMETLLRDGLIDGVLDLATQELAIGLSTEDEMADPDRLKVAGSLGVPQVVSPGGLDSVKFRFKDSIPEDYLWRKNQVYPNGDTYIRTSIDERRNLGKNLADRLNQSCKGSGITRVLLPKNFLSMDSSNCGPLDDGEPGSTLQDALEEFLDHRKILVTRSEDSLNTRQFGKEAAKMLVEMMSLSS